MKTAEWKPNEDDKFRATEAYIGYLSGVAILHNPDIMQNVVPVELRDGEHLSNVVSSAERLIMDGLVEVIKFAHPEERRSPMSAMEHHFESAFPHMRDTVTRTYQKHSRRLDRLNPMLFAIRPAPMLHEKEYRYICHQRWRKLQLPDLMGEFRPHPSLRSIVEELPLAQTRLKVS